MDSLSQEGFYQVEALTPVSYTHLDLYKRQVINQPIMYGPTKQLIAAAKTAQPIHMKKHDFIPLKILSYLPAPRFCPQ